MSYKETSEWASYREEALKNADGHCQLCYSDTELHVHHRRYNKNDPAGVYDVSDLTVLCKKCHWMYHAAQKSGMVSKSNSKAEFSVKNYSVEEIKKISSELKKGFLSSAPRKIAYDLCDIIDSIKITKATTPKTFKKKASTLVRKYHAS